MMLLPPDPRGTGRRTWKVVDLIMGIIRDKAGHQLSLLCRYRGSEAKHLTPAFAEPHHIAISYPTPSPRGHTLTGSC